MSGNSIILYKDRKDTPSLGEVFSVVLGSLTHTAKVFPSQLKLVLDHHLCCYIFSVGERFLVEQHLFIAKFSVQCSAMMIAYILEHSCFFLDLVDKCVKQWC